jgi:hypothetical protein
VETFIEQIKAELPFPGALSTKAMRSVLTGWKDPKARKVIAIGVKAGETLAETKLVVSLGDGSPSFEVPVICVMPESGNPLIDTLRNLYINERFQSKTVSQT